MAGGVGITPFASMLRHLMASGEKRDIVLIYAASSEEDFAYRDLIKAAEARLGLRAVYVARTVVTEDIVKREVPDYAERTFYLSGPNAMVRAYRRMLLGLSVHRSRIKTDYFPGF
jgi:ferredoxin-NADP reductase